VYFELTSTIDFLYASSGRLSLIRANPRMPTTMYPSFATRYPGRSFSTVHGTPFFVKNSAAFVNVDLTTSIDRSSSKPGR